MYLYCRHWLRRRAAEEDRFRQSPSLAADSCPAPFNPPEPLVNPDSPRELGRDEGLEKSSCCAMAVLLYPRDEPQKQ